MLDLIEVHRAEIATLCDCFHVRRLGVFGSAAPGLDLDPDRSDIDFPVSRDPGVLPAIVDHFAFRDRLAALAGRPVGLVMAGAVRNPYLRAGIERSRKSRLAA
jgi:hypothetical protein